MRSRGGSRLDAAMQKHTVDDLALFAGPRMFGSIISTSNLVRPDIERFLDYSRRFHEAKHYTNEGPMVRLIEARLADFHQTRHCITFANGFWAIVMTITALALPGRSEVVMPSLTYRRLADIAAWTRLKPRFCEVDPGTLAVTAETVEACLTRETALILAAHPIVNCCDVERIAALGSKADLPVVFDSVESVYETVPGGKIGSFGDAECFSLHASKLINGFEGGYVTTSNDELAGRLKVMRGFGFFGPDNVIEFGLNAKLIEPHACMALASLDDLEAQVSRNRKRYNRYKKLLPSVSGLRLVEFDETQRTSYKNIVVEVTGDWALSRAETLDLLHAEGALARPYYAPPLHQKKMSYPHIPVILPETDRLAELFLLLPCGHFVSEPDIDSLCGLLAFIGENASAIREKRRS
jgi:dTDP-4-amino-4,6-dideoxygalactose transaminase